MIKLKAKITFEVEYEANPKNYGTDDVSEMIDLDSAGIEENLLDFIDMNLDECTSTIEVKEV